MLQITFSIELFSGITITVTKAGESVNAVWFSLIEQEHIYKSTPEKRYFLSDVRSITVESKIELNGEF